MSRKSEHSTEVTYYIHDGYIGTKGRPQFTSVDENNFCDLAEDEIESFEEFKDKIDDFLWEEMFERLGVSTSEETYKELWAKYVSWREEEGYGQAD